MKSFEFVGWRLVVFCGHFCFWLYFVFDSPSFSALRARIIAVVLTTATVTMAMLVVLSCSWVARTATTAMAADAVVVIVIMAS